jgi:glycerol kinase
MAAKHILAIDQGTTSTRAIVFDASGRPTASAQKELPQIFPKPGWVEHDPEQIWSATVEVCREALARAKLDATALAGIGITNQRETTVVWDRTTGKPIHNAIVWQDRRTAQRCDDLRRAGHEEEITAKTGLILDPYFSGTKIAWILDHVAGSRDAAEKGALAAGTIECFLLWRLTGGKVHASDATNASRSLLLDIHSGAWDADLLKLIGVPRALLPKVVDCSGELGVAVADILGAPVPVLGMAGDQQAATVGQACIEPGMVKATYGTGCFALLNTGSIAMRSHNRLLTTIAYQLAGRRTYALEGSIFVAGAAVQWLRDGLGLIETSSEVEAVAQGAKAGHGVYMVPAFVGLGAPYWDAGARGGGDRGGHARFGLLPDPRPRRGDARRWRPDRRAARRRRHGGERLADAAAGRHCRHAGRAAEGDGNHGAGCRFPGRPAGRSLAIPGCTVEELGARPRLPPGRGRGLARPPLCRLEGCRAPGAQFLIAAERRRH